MTPLRQKMSEDMQLRGLSEITQDRYVRAVRQLAEHYDESPDKITEEELRQYFLYLKNDKKAARSTCTIALCGIKFFYEHTLKREWPTLTLIRPPREHKLPVVLSVDEVRQVLGYLRLPHYRVCLSTIYSCGLRLKEGVGLQVKDIDSSRMVLQVRKGKGRKDRYVPFPERTLAQLRWYWQQHRQPKWLFPGRGFGERGPMNPSGVQKAFRAAVQASGLNKAASVHTLRHSYATHLVEAGVNLHLIQGYLGHDSLQTTAIYVHVTPQAQRAAVATINELMTELP